MFLEEILKPALNLINKYIEQNKYVIEQPSTTSMSYRFNINLCWLFGKDIDLTATKVNRAREFLKIIQQYTKEYSKPPEEQTHKISLENTLKSIKDKIELELETTSKVRIQHEVAAGTYDATLNVFLKFISYMLKREVYLEKAIQLEQEKNTILTKVLLLLERNLFVIMFEQYAQEQSILNLPEIFPAKYSGGLSKMFTDTISALKAFKIEREKQKTKEEEDLEILWKERILLKTILNGLIRELEKKKEHSSVTIGINNIIEELTSLSSTIELEQNKYEEECQQQLQQTRATFAIG